MNRRRHDRHIRRGRPVDPRSKLSRARALYDRRKSRQEVMKLFRRRLRISAACAATYYQLARA